MSAWVGILLSCALMAMVAGTSGTINMSLRSPAPVTKSPYCPTSRLAAFRHRFIPTTPSTSNVNQHSIGVIQARQKPMKAMVLAQKDNAIEDIEEPAIEPQWLLLKEADYVKYGAALKEYGLQGVRCQVPESKTEYIEDLKENYHSTPRQFASWNDRTHSSLTVYKTEFHRWTMDHNGPPKVEKLRSIVGSGTLDFVKVENDSATIAAEIQRVITAFENSVAMSADKNLGPSFLLLDVQPDHHSLFVQCMQIFQPIVLAMDTPPACSIIVHSGGYSDDPARPSDGYLIYKP